MKTYDVGFPISDTHVTLHAYDVQDCMKTAKLYADMFGVTNADFGPVTKRGLIFTIEEKCDAENEDSEV